MRRLALVLLSAGLYALAFPPWDVTALACVALIPFLLAIRDLALWRSAVLGLVWGTVMIHAIGHWVPVAIAVYWQQPVWFGFAFSITAGMAFVGAYGAGFAMCATRVSARSHGLPRALLLAMLWVAWEVARARVLTGDPWLLLGYAPASYPALIQIADLGGVYAVSFVLAFVNAAVAECVPSVRMFPLPPGEGQGEGDEIDHAPGMTVWPLARPTFIALTSLLSRWERMRFAGLAAPITAITLLAAVAAYGHYRLNQPLPDAPAIPIAIVQGNNNLGSQWNAGHYGQGLATYLQLSATAVQRHPRMVIWPESAVTFFLAREPQYQAVIAQFLAKADADLLLGAPHIEDDDPARPRYFNSAFYMTPTAGVTQRYDKVHLMPFGEYFPLRTIELLRRRFERVRYFTPGDALRLLDTRLGKTAVVICFEAMFPELVRARMNAGAEVLVNLSNDAWLGDGAGPKQHASMTIFRAIENRTWVVRATTTGVSMVIDPHGIVREQSPLLTPAVLHASIVPLRVETTYERYGDVFAYACIAFAILGMLFLSTGSRPPSPHRGFASKR